LSVFDLRLGVFVDKVWVWGRNWFLKNMRMHTAKDKKPEETSHGLDEDTGGTGEADTDE